MTLKNEKIKERLFFAYKILFSLLLLPVVGYIVYKGIGKTKEDVAWHETGYFKDESEFDDPVVKTYIHERLEPSQNVKLIDWSTEPFTIREGMTLRWVKYSVHDSVKGHELFYDRVFFIEKGKVVKIVDLE